MLTTHAFDLTRTFIHDHFVFILVLSLITLAARLYAGRLQTNYFNGMDEQIARDLRLRGDSTTYTFLDN